MKSANHTSLRRALLRWYRANARDLPWRRTNDPYQIWLSEVMLQQTRVETVVPYYERWLRVFPAVQDLAAASQSRVLKMWEGLGYYTRARNLHRAAQAVVEQRDGAFPQTAEDWQELSGVGRYTAGAIASIANGEAVPTVDGNIKRVLARLFEVESPLGTPETEARLWALADEILARSAPGDFNQALMELGATVCTSRPRCVDCPVQKYCRGCASGSPERLPRRGRDTVVKQVREAAAIIVRRSRVLLVQRPSSVLLANLWTVPAVDVSEVADGFEALREHLSWSFGLEVEFGASIGTIRHRFTHRDLRVDVYAVTAVRGRLRCNGSVNVAWVKRDELGEYACANVDRKILALVQWP